MFDLPSTPTVNPLSEKKTYKEEFAEFLKTLEEFQALAESGRKALLSVTAQACIYAAKLTMKRIEQDANATDEDRYQVVRYMRISSAEKLALAVHQTFHGD